MASTYYKDPAGITHKVTVIECGVKMTTIEYFDNTRRGDRWKAGRRYNHGTRTRVRVYNHEVLVGD